MNLEALAAHLFSATRALIPARRGEILIGSDQR
jgi:hypothetical protein